VAEVVILVSK